MAETSSNAMTSAASSTTRGVGTLLLLLAFAFAQGCATNLSKPDGTPQPTPVRLSTFKTITMKKIEIAPDFASAGANQKAAKKINQVLVDNMRMVFPNLQEIDGGGCADGSLDRAVDPGDQVHRGSGEILGRRHGGELCRADEGHLPRRVDR